MQENPSIISSEKKHFYRFVKIYSNENNDKFFIFVTRSKDLSTTICKFKKSMCGQDTRISFIVEDCSYYQVKSGFYTSLEATFERCFLNDNLNELIKGKIENYVM